MSEIKAAVVVNLKVEGIHCWPDCPFEDVAFLRNPHRHLFTVTATKLVSHDDRDIEIIRLKRAMTVYLNPRDGHEARDFGAQSCEMIARDLMEQFNLLNVHVLEDGENGAYLWRAVKPEAKQ